MSKINLAERRSGWFDHAGNPIDPPEMATGPDNEPDGSEPETDPAELSGLHPIEICVKLVALWKADPQSFTGPLRDLVTEAEKFLADLPF